MGFRMGGVLALSGALYSAPDNEVRPPHWNLKAGFLGLPLCKPASTREDMRVFGSEPLLILNTAMEDGANRYRSVCPPRSACVLLPVLRRASCEWLCVTEALRRLPKATSPI